MDLKNRETLIEEIQILFNELKLLYYEYDKYQNKFIKDKRYSKDTSYNEFIKLTYELSKQKIQFFIDENSDIIISNHDTLLSHLKQRVKNITYNIVNNSKNIYILSDKTIDFAKNLPLINTKSIDTIVDIKKYDALIFTSKQGVVHLNRLTQEWKNIPSYAISTQTAKEIKDLGGKLEFIGKQKHGDLFANELLSKLEDKKTAFIGAKTVVSDLVNILKENNIDCEHISIYETVCVSYEDKIDLPDDSIIIFSSPSTINCFFKNVHWKESFRAISIGDTTAKYFPNGIKPIISDNTSLQSCVQKALSL